jgi:type VI protein secretion system component VasF
MVNETLERVLNKNYPLVPEAPELVQLRLRRQRDEVREACRDAVKAFAEALKAHEFSGEHGPYVYADRIDAELAKWLE